MLSPDAALSPFERLVSLALMLYLFVACIGVAMQTENLLALFVACCAFAGMAWVVWQVWQCPMLVQPDDEIGE